MRDRRHWHFGPIQRRRHDDGPSHDLLLSDYWQKSFDNICILTEVRLNDFNLGLIGNYEIKLTMFVDFPMLFQLGIVMGYVRAFAKNL
jgi:hypothetical protein